LGFGGDGFSGVVGWDGTSAVAHSRHVAQTQNIDAGILAATLELSLHISLEWKESYDQVSGQRLKPGKRYETYLQLLSNLNSKQFVLPQPPAASCSSICVFFPVPGPGSPAPLPFALDLPSFSSWTSSHFS